MSGSQLVVLQLTAPGFPDLPAGTPHLLAHPLGSACFQLPNSVRCLLVDEDVDVLVEVLLDVDVDVDVEVDVEVVVVSHPLHVLSH